MEHEKLLTPVQVCMDNKGQNLHQNALVVNPLPSPLAAEANACLEALRWVRAQVMKCLTIQTDCVLVKILQSQGEVTGWQIMSIVSDIINYSKIGRNVIQPAHKLTTDVIKLFN
ncbi:hypothetical protein CsSME_00025603 [Camellia sinensis var. sinensis]